MKLFNSLFLILFTVHISCFASEPKEIDINKIVMQIETEIEQGHYLYNSCDFVCNGDHPDCCSMRVEHTITISNGKLTIDKGCEYESSHKIKSGTYYTGKIFRDRGFEEVYNFFCTELENDKLTSLGKHITIINAKDGNRKQTIIHIFSYDVYNTPVHVETYINNWDI